MKKLLGGLVCVLALLASAGAWAQIADINQAVNKAGRQRMLSQRMAKLYLQIGQNVDTERSKRNLDNSLALFDRQLVELKTYAPTPLIKETYQKLERVWLGYKDVLIGATPTPESARKVMAMSEEVLSLAHQGTVQLEKHGGTQSARLVNIAGRQRMLSQRMAKFYQAIAWNVAPSNGSAELEQARKEFVAGLSELEGASINTQGINDELGLGRQQWSFFDGALKGQGTDKHRLANNMATTSERILEVMDNITGMYEKIIK